MTYYEQIRQACIKNRPEILDLKMGCEVQFPDGKAIIEKRYDDMVGEVYKLIGVDCASFEKGCFGILGRPLHLEDILMLIGKNGDYAIDCFGLIMKNEDGEHYETGYWDGKERKQYPRYDLSKSVENQSEEALKFICDNIK